MIRTFVALLCAGILLAGCSASKSASESNIVSARESNLSEPAARIYKVAPEYADHVAVAVNGGRLVSFPAPSDITPATAPIPLAEGWYLDRQGVGPYTVFLKWTRDEYAAMHSAPTPAEIMAAVIPGARVSELYELPMTISDAQSDTAAVDRLIEAGLPGCKPLINVFRFNPG